MNEPNRFCWQCGAAVDPEFQVDACFEHACPFCFTACPGTCEEAQQFLAEPCVHCGLPFDSHLKEGRTDYPCADGRTYLTEEEVSASQEEDE